MTTDPRQQDREVHLAELLGDSGAHFAGRGCKSIQRILVTGNAGSGKTTVAREVGRALSLPVLGLDQVVWRTGWKPTSKAEREPLLREIAERPRWAVDGVSSILETAADLVIFLDVPPRVCTWRCARRSLSYLFRTRPGLPDNCPEWRIIPTLLRIIWHFDRDVRPSILERARKANSRQLYWQVEGGAEKRKVLEQVMVALDGAKVRVRA